MRPSPRCGRSVSTWTLARGHPSEQDKLEDQGFIRPDYGSCEPELILADSRLDTLGNHFVMTRPCGSRFFHTTGTASTLRWFEKPSVQVDGDKIGTVAILQRLDGCTRHYAYAVRAPVLAMKSMTHTHRNAVLEYLETVYSFGVGSSKS